MPTATPEMQFLPLLNSAFISRMSHFSAFTLSPMIYAPGHRRSQAISSSSASRPQHFGERRLYGLHLVAALVLLYFYHEQPPHLFGHASYIYASPAYFLLGQFHIDFRPVRWFWRRDEDGHYAPRGDTAYARRVSARDYRAAFRDEFLPLIFDARARPFDRQLPTISSSLSHAQAHSNRRCTRSRWLIFTRLRAHEAPRMIISSHRVGPVRHDILAPHYGRRASRVASRPGLLRPYMAVICHGGSRAKARLRLRRGYF